jgi:hypothetical protein
MSSNHLVDALLSLNSCCTCLSSLEQPWSISNTCKMSMAVLFWHQVYCSDV